MSDDRRKRSNGGSGGSSRSVHSRHMIWGARTPSRSALWMHVTNPYLLFEFYYFLSACLDGGFHFAFGEMQSIIPGGGLEARLLIISAIRVAGNNSFVRTVVYVSDMKQVRVRR